MANVMAMIVNGGTVYKPHLIKEIRDPVSGEVVSTIEPTVLRTSTISSETFLEMRKLLRGVVVDGTAEVIIKTEAVKIAGKTGTGEVGLEEQWDSWFVAFGPYNAPPEDAVVVVVFVESVNTWEWWAPKAANLIFQGIFADQTFEEVVRTLKPWYVPR
jgi:penicillin-binding protein 2